MAEHQLPGAGDFPSNNQTSKKVPAVAERPQVQKVVSGNATEKKKSVWKRIAASFTGDDARTVGEFVLMDVIVPSAKSLISDALTTTVERFFYGDGRIQRSGGRPTSYGPYSPYNRVSTTTLGSGSAPWGQQVQPQQLSRRARANHDFREALIDSRQEAAVVLDTITQMADMYEVATVADFYDAVGFTSEFTDRNWGWTPLELREAQITRVRDGRYVIQLPPPIPIK